jgi:uncharacterized membrane protein
MVFLHLREWLRSAFWLVPAACAAGAVLLAIGLVSLDDVIGELSAFYLFPGPPEGARSVLGAIISAMISFTGLVFSITIVVLQLTSSQFSPRVLRNFLRDRTIRWSLGVFVATFVYAMTVIREVQGTNTAGAFVPRIAVTGAYVLVLISVAVFIHYIHHIANMIRIATVIAGIGDESRRLIGRHFPADPPPAPPPPDLTASEVVSSRRAGVIVAVDERTIVEQARRADAVVVLVPRVGDFVPAGAPLFRIRTSGTGRRRSDDDFTGRLDRLVGTENERSVEQDLAFSFRQLVDIGERALSSGINDPTTATQVIDVLHDLLRRLAGRELPSGRFADHEGYTRLVVPQYGFDDYLQVAVAELWHYGSDDSRVRERLAAMLRDLHAVARPQYRAAIRGWQAVVVESTQES